MVCPAFPYIGKIKAKVTALFLIGITLKFFTGKKLNTVYRIYRKHRNRGADDIASLLGEIRVSL